MKKKKLTPEEFKQKMQQIEVDYESDRELMHIEADNLMCELLEKFGYSEGIKVFTICTNGTHNIASANKNPLKL